MCKTNRSDLFGMKLENNWFKSNLRTYGLNMIYFSPLFIKLVSVNKETKDPNESRPPHSVLNKTVRTRERGLK